MPRVTIPKRTTIVPKNALREEKQRWKGKGRLEMELKRVGLRPAGETPADSPEVRAVVEATKALGGEATLHAGSTDANVGMSLGIPSLTIGGGGSGSGAHSPGETFDVTDSWRGTERALRVALALAEESP